MPGTGPNRRVLVVDDDRASREALRASLAAAGFDVEGVSTDVGLTADLLEHLKPGLVLLDANIGGLRHPDAVRIVTESRQKIGARLLVIGHEEAALERLARELGADGFVTKTRLGLNAAEALSRSVVPREAAAIPLAPPTTEARRPTPPPFSKAPSVDILGMIEEELAQASAAPTPPGNYLVLIDLFSDHNFYLAKTPSGQQVGVFVSTALPPPIGSVVQLTLTLPGGRRIECKGEVLWVRARAVLGGRLPAGAGIRMIDLSDQDKQHVRAFLSERVPYTYTGT